jgi:hypothetical protein
LLSVTTVTRICSIFLLLNRSIHKFHGTCRSSVTEIFMSFSVTGNNCNKNLDYFSVTGNNHNKNLDYFSVTGNNCNRSIHKFHGTYRSLVTEILMSFCVIITAVHMLYFAVTGVNCNKNLQYFFVTGNNHNRNLDYLSVTGQ